MSQDGWPFGDLRMFGYDLILADPPWEFELYSEAGEEKSAAAHYDTMPLDEIMALPVGHLARGDCLLLMWATGCMLPQCLQVVRAWGFEYKTEIVWLKKTRRGKVSMGTGYRARSQHEPLLLATTGNPKHKPFRSTFDGVARGHSVKPEESFAMIEKAMPSAFRCELFARGSRPGWDTWGKERAKFDADPSARERRGATAERRARNARNSGRIGGDLGGHPGLFEAGG